MRTGQELVFRARGRSELLTLLRAFCFGLILLASVLKLEWTRKISLEYVAVIRAKNHTCLFGACGLADGEERRYCKIEELTSTRFGDGCDNPEEGGIVGD